MRNLKNLSAAVLVVALVLTSMTAVFAADEATVANADKALTLKDMGLYSGQDANDPKVGLVDALTTQDSLIFLAKLFGYFETASALIDDEVAEDLAKFDDAASISEYAKKVVAYSAANGILSGSTQDGKFFVGAKDTVTAARFATFMLKQMGYSVADYKESVAKLAETKGSKVDATVTGDLTRDAAVGVMYGALTAEKASGKKVIEDIVGDNADLRKKAERIGLIDPPPTSDVAVESVKALNCKQIEIVFNQEMDRDLVESEDYYEIKDKGDKIIELGDNSASLDSDNKTVIITLDKKVADMLTNSTEATVKIKRNIKTKNNKRLDKDAVFENVAVQDGLIPTVTKAEATGEKNIRITFSEPVYDKGDDNSIAEANFKVVSGTYEYYVQKATLNNNVINLVVGTELVEGPIDVTVNNAGTSDDNAIVDYAGYAVFKAKTTFNYVKDTSVSVVTVKSAKEDRVVLGFSKPIKGTNIKLYHTTKNDASKMATATTTDYVDEIIFTYDSDTITKLPDGNISLYLINSNDNDNDKLVDAYGIKVPDQTLTCTVVIDKTPPVFVSGDFDKDESIELLFDEKLDKEYAKKAENYEVNKVKDNTVISFLPKIEDKKEEVVTLVANPKLDDNTEYQVTIKKARDIYRNEITKNYTYTFTTGDYKHPKVIDDPNIYPHCSALAQKGEITIVYSEPMNEAQMLDKANYMVSIDEGKNYKVLGDDDSITMVNDKTITIYVKELKNKNDPTIRPYVKIAAIMDLSGKRLYGRIDAYTVENIGVEPVIVTVKSAKEKQVVLSFSKPVKGSNIKLYHTDKNNEANKAIADAANYVNEITFTFGSKLPIGKLDLYLVNSTTANEMLIDRNDIKVPDQSLTCNVEGIPAKVTVKSAKGNTVVLSFSKPVKGSNIMLSYNNELYRADATRTYYTNEIEFRFNNSLPLGELKLYLVNSEIEDERLVDNEGVFVPDQTLSGVVEVIPSPSPSPASTSRTETDNTPPAVISCTVNSNESITITFSERLNMATATDSASYVVKKSSESEEIPLSATIDESRKSVELNFHFELEDNTKYQLLIKKYKDTSGNENKSDYEYNFTTSDHTAPKVTKCTVNRNESITIVFDEKLDEDTATNPNSYVVKKLPGGERVSLSAAIDEAMTSVELSFDTKLEDNSDYQLLIKKYKDTSGNENASDYVFDFTTLESIPPEVINNPEDDYDCFVVVEKGKISINYSEAMNETQMLDKGNYQVSIDQGLNYRALGDDDSITKVDDRRVLIYVKELEGTYLIPYVKIAPIEDLAGNKLYDSDEPYIIENIEPENVHVEEAQLIAKNKIKLVFNKKMGSFNLGDFEILSTTPGEISFSACESNTVNSDGKTEVVLILNKDLTTDAKDESGTWVEITTVPTISSESELGSKLLPYFSFLDDKVTPVIVMWDHDNDESTPEVAKVIASGDIANPQYYGDDYSVPSGFFGIITIFFSETIDVSTLTVDTFNVDGFTITGITVHAEAKTVVLAVTVHTAHASVKTTVTQVSEIHDLAGNALATAATWEVTLDERHTN